MAAGRITQTRQTLRQFALNKTCKLLVAKVFIVAFLLVIGAGCSDRDRPAKTSEEQSSTANSELATDGISDPATSENDRLIDTDGSALSAAAPDGPTGDSLDPLDPGIAPSGQPSKIDADDIPAALEAAGLAMAREPSREDAERALKLYASVLLVDGSNAAALEGIEDAEKALLEIGEAALAIGQLEEAGRAELALNAGLPEQTVRSLEFSARLQDALQVQSLLGEAEALIKAGRRVFPEDRSAAKTYRDVLAISPGNPTALTGLDNIVASILEEATEAAESGDYDEAEQRLAEATLVGSSTDAVQNAATRIVELRQARAAQLVEQINSQIVNRDLDGAAARLADLENVSAQAEGVDDLRLRIENARIYGGLRPGQVIRDLMASGATSPALVVIPTGTFEMGSPTSERDRKTNESPQREVAIAIAFAMSQSEVTVAEFRAFVEATGYRPSSEIRSGSTVYDEKSGSMADRSGVTWQQDYVGRRAADDLPVVHVSWDDANAYALWMAAQTGKSYRLPSEAEFEYVLRGGSQERYPWGDREPMRVVGNVTGDGDRSASKRNWVNAFRDYSDGHWGPAPVRSFEPNSFGVHDIVGNVSEWVEDCWHDSYQRAPRDARAWVNPGCSRRVIRGSGWSSAPDQVRSAFRINAEPSSTSARVGFRVVRGLD